MSIGIREAHRADVRTVGTTEITTLVAALRRGEVAWLNGAQLDPLPPGTSKQEHVRYLDIHEDDEMDLDQLRDWIRQAARLPGEETF